MPNYLALLQPNGEMPERLNGPVSKTGVGATPPGVQIPLSPPLFKHLSDVLSVTKIPLRKSEKIH
jgi:hypothetical protein